MNKYMKKFLQRGIAFGGLGPIVLGIVFAILGATVEDFHIEGWQILLAIVSTYFIAFIQAGASVFNQIEHWSIGRSLGLHFLTLYLAYTICYLINSWIPFEPMVLLIFTAIFAVSYIVIWAIVFFSVKASEGRFNRRLK